MRKMLTIRTIIYLACLDLIVSPVVRIVQTGIARVEAARGRFDAHLWKVDRRPDNIHSVRMDMAEDLSRRILKPGMLRSQTRKLLGDPDSTSDYDRQNHREGYDLGYRWGRMDPTTLELQFDKQGRLKESYLQEH